MAEGTVSIGLVGGQRDRFACFCRAAREFAIGEFRPAQNRHRVERFGQQGLCRSIVRIQLYRLGDQLAETGGSWSATSMANRPRTQNQIKGGRIGPRMIELPPTFDLGDVGGRVPAIRRAIVS